MERDPAEAARLRSEMFEQHRDAVRLVDFPVYQAVGHEPAVLVGWQFSNSVAESVRIQQGDFFAPVTVAVWTEREPTRDVADYLEEMRAGGGDPRVSE